MTIGRHTIEASCAARACPRAQRLLTLPVMNRPTRPGPDESRITPMPRRLTLALLALLIAGLPARAQTPIWPTHQVKLIVPFGAGSTPDVIMRVIADHLKEKS